MKKTILLSVLAVTMMVGKSFAQATAIATLFHEGNETAFYGADALKYAHDASVHGDTIILSKGLFNGNIDKWMRSVFVRGMGMDNTVIKGNVKFYGEYGNGCIFEGIWFDGAIHQFEHYGTNISNITFVKCKIYEIYPKWYSGGENDGYISSGPFNIINCIITHLMDCGNNAIVNVVNSFVYNLCSYGNNPMVTCTNCVVAFDTNSYTEDYSAITYASFENCIIGDIGKDSFHSGLTFTNCIGLIIGGDEGLGDVTTFEGASEESTGNIAGINQEEVFKTFHTSDWNGALLDNNETFELTETAAATYLGTDGTQVGMHGGSVPFSRTIYPRITKFEVAPKAVDGKVKVNVEVNGGE